MSTASQKLAKRVELHTKLRQIDDRIEGRIAKSRLISVHDLVKMRERACAELSAAGFQPWPNLSVQVAGSR